MIEQAPVRLGGATYKMPPRSPPDPPSSILLPMEDGVVWAVEVKPREQLFAKRVTLHGNGSLAATEVGYARPGARASRLLARAEIVVACLKQVELDRRNGIPLLPVVRRKLTDSVAQARKRGGATRRSAAALPNLEQAFEEFRRHHGIEDGEVRATPSPEIAGAISTPGQARGRLSPQGEVKGRELVATPPVRPSLLRWKLPRALRDLRKPSRYKALHGGRGSGKSHVFAELLVRRRVDTPTRSEALAAGSRPGGGSATADWRRCRQPLRPADVLEVLPNLPGDGGGRALDVDA